MAAMTSADFLAANGFKPISLWETLVDFFSLMKTWKANHAHDN